MWLHTSPQEINWNGKRMNELKGLFWKFMKGASDPVEWWTNKKNFYHKVLFEIWIEESSAVMWMFIQRGAH